MSAPLLDKPAPPDADPTAGLLAALAELAELLEQEYAALRRADAAAVANIASQKRQLTDSLAHRGRPGATATGVGALPLPVGELAQRCHDLNRRNGELLRLQQSMLTRAMRVLSGNDSSPSVYGSRGQTSPTAAGRHIASV